MDALFRWMRSFIAFTATIFGTIHTPYQTYRSIAWKPDFRHLAFVVMLVSGYLAFATLVRGGLRASPLFLTSSFTQAGFGIGISYIYSVLFIHYVGSWVSAAKKNLSPTLLPLALLWAYTLIPTILWFLSMSLFYYLLPPPRTPSLLGQIASAFFICLSIALLFWKIILYYLTLRFGMRLSLGRIVVFSCLFFPATSLYAWVMYKIGFFRVPFI